MPGSFLQRHDVSRSAIDHHTEDRLHRINQVHAENIAHQFPERPFAAKLCPCSLEKPAAHLLHLINQKGEHHEDGEHGAEILLAETVIVSKVITLIFQGVEGFILDFPAGAAGPHNRFSVFLGDLQVGYTVDGNRRKYTLKKGYPDIGLGEAVKIYNEIKSKAIDGDDPLAERVKQKTAPTIQDVMDHYFTETSMAPKTRSESVRLSNKDIISVLGRKRAIDLTRQDVKTLHRGIVERGASVVANRTVELLRRAFNCAYGEELIDINPFPDLKKIQGTESPRDKVLKDCEIKAIWTALERGKSRRERHLAVIVAPRSTIHRNDVDGC